MENIDTFIEKEKEYFAPMLKRQISSTESQRAIWRNETVHQRRNRVSLELFDALQGKIIDGPFKGMNLTKNTWWGSSDLGSMLLGLYEKEILDFISKINIDNKLRNFNTFIDIGAADGYYACGLLYSGKIAEAICFERNIEGQDTIKKNWEQNGCPGRLKIYGEATTDSLKLINDCNFSKTLILIDIEGGEFDLLTDEFLYTIQKSTVIIEIHNWVQDFIEKYESFLLKIGKFFRVSTMQRVERHTLQFDILRDFTDDSRLLLTSEGRPCVMRFLVLYPYQT